MKYIKFTHVDAITGIPVTQAPAINGPRFPNVNGLEFRFARESQYPTDTPEFFGTCPDDSSTNVAGVISVLAQIDYQIQFAQELCARPESDALIDQARSALILASDLFAKSKRDAIVSNISAAEMASWPIKRSEALSWQAAGAAATDAMAPNLAMEAQARGISLASLVDKVLAKAADLSQLEALIAGVNGRHNDAILAMETAAEIAGYDITEGWPV
jgi:hypothetical protein